MRISKDEVAPDLISPEHKVLFWQWPVKWSQQAVSLRAQSLWQPTLGWANLYTLSWNRSVRGGRQWENRKGQEPAGKVKEASKREKYCGMFCLSEKFNFLLTSFLFSMYGSPFSCGEVEMEASITICEITLHCCHPCSRFSIKDW